LKLRSSLAYVLVVVFGCVGFAQSARSNGIVWLYRPNSDRSNLSPTIFEVEIASSRKLARLERGQFFGIQLSPGEHAFSWTNAPARGERFIIELKPGQQAYLEVKFQSITRVEGAVVDSRGFRPVDSVNVFDSEVIVPAQGVQILGPVAVQPRSSTTVQEVKVAPSPPPAPVMKADPGPAIATLPSASASPSPTNPATFTSDPKLPGQRSPSENDEEALNSPRRFETFWAPYSISRWGQMNLYGGEVELAVKLTNRFALIANVGDHRSINSAVTTGSGFLTSGHVETLTYQFGPKFSIRPNDRLTVFAQVAAGRTRVKARYDFGTDFTGANFTLDALGNGLVISGGGGVDLAIKKWLGIRLVQSEYSHNRIEGATSHDLRIGTGLVFRIK